MATTPPSRLALARDPNRKPDDPFAPLKSAGSYALSQVTPDRFKGDQAGQLAATNAELNYHPSTMQYLHDVAASLDPRTKAGLLNWAATFVPGPGGKGGRFTGPLTPNQRMLMDSLANVSTHKGPPDWLLERMQQAGIEPSERALNQEMRISMLRPEADIPHFTPSRTGGKEGLKDMLDVFGITNPNPLGQLETNVMNTNLEPGQRLQDVQSKLGLSKSEWPSWVTGKSTLNLFNPSRERMRPGDEPLSVNDRETWHSMRHELSDDQKIQLAMIIATILRRQVPPGGTHGSLGEPGSN